VCVDGRNQTRYVPKAIKDALAARRRIGAAQDSGPAPDTALLESCAAPTWTCCTGAAPATSTMRSTSAAFVFVDRRY
jgi:hypothetical protein